jgi:hypothetical protein
MVAEHVRAASGGKIAREADGATSRRYDARGSM